jgi:hypothetical protein
MSGTLEDHLSEQSLGENSPPSPNSSLLYLQPTLKHSHKSTTGVQRSFAAEEELPTRHERPHDHLGGDPHIRSYSLADELRRQLGTQEGDAVQSRGGVVIVRVQTDVVQEVVRVCLLNVSAGEIQHEEGCKARLDDVRCGMTGPRRLNTLTYSRPSRDSPVDLTDKRNLFPPCPAFAWIKSMDVLVFGTWLVERRQFFIVEDGRLRCDIVQAQSVIALLPKSRDGRSDRAAVVLDAFNIDQVSPSWICVFWVISGRACGGS